MFRVKACFQTQTQTKSKMTVSIVHQDFCLILFIIIICTLSVFLTHGSSKGRKVSHCYRSRCCYSESTCTARVVQFEVVVVAQNHRSQQWSSWNESGNCGGSGRLRVLNKSQYASYCTAQLSAQVCKTRRILLGSEVLIDMKKRMQELVSGELMPQNLWY